MAHSVDDFDPTTAFNKLNLNTPGAVDPHPETKRIVKRRRKPKNEKIWVDLESPYAEYLPALYREWAPKEKNRLVSPRKSGMKRAEMSHIYKTKLGDLNLS